MNWQEEKKTTISVYDLSNQENQNSGDISIEYKTGKFSDSSHPNKFIPLRTKPSQSLIFSQAFHSIHLKLYNDNSFPILFKLKTTQPDILTSQPARGFIQAHSFIQCQLIPMEIQSPILLVIQYAQLINQYDDYLTQWKNLKSEHIQIRKLSCSFQDNQQSRRTSSWIKPILVTLTTMTLLTTLIYLKKK